MRPDPALKQRARSFLPRRWGLSLVLPMSVILLVALVLVQYFRPIPAVAGTATAGGEHRVSGDPPVLPWPAKGQAAVAIAGLGTVGTFGGEQPLPIASITKVMTAYVVLQDHPLAAGDQGPQVTMTADDVTDFKQRQASGESTVAVTAGEKWTQYQLLQGLLIPSGNNLANTLARFDAGSVDAFVAKMNAAAAKLGMAHSRFADTSGASHSSVSTATDLLLLERAALALPLVADIVKQPEATLPTAGRVFNVDAILGQEGIIGMKTGSLPDIAVANFAFAATAQVSGQTITILGAVTGQDTLANAFDATKALVRAVRATVRSEKLVSAADQVALYEAPWGARTTVLAPKDVVMLTWPGLLARTTVQLKPLTAPSASDTPAGTITITLGDQDVRLDLRTSSPLPAPGRVWRLTRTG